MPFFLCIISELVTFVKCKNLQNLITMKKYTFLLLGLILSLNLINAADVNHPAQTICETDAKPQFSTTNTGDTYTWYKKQTNGSWTQVSSGSNKYTPTDAGEYKCEVITNGGTTNSGNLLSSGGFNFAPSSKGSGKGIRFKENVIDKILNTNYQVEYQLDDFMTNGNADPGEYTTSTNPNSIKSQYFSKIEPKEGSHMLVVDGRVNSNEFKIFSVYGLKLKGGQEYEFSCWAANIDEEYETKNHGTGSLAKIRFLIKTGETNHTFIPLEAENGDGHNYLQVPEKRSEWTEFKSKYKPTNDTWADIIIENTTNVASGDGNDFVIDAVYFGATKKTAGTKDNEFFELKIDSKPTITMPTIADQCPNTSIEIKPTVLKVGSSPKYTWSGDATGNLINTTITSASNVNGLKKCSLKVENGKCTSTADITIKTKDCGVEEPISHPLQEACPGVEVELKCKTSITGAQSVKWDHDSSSGQSVKVNAGPNVGDKKDFKCTIVKIDNGTTVTYIETFTVKTKDCTTEKTETHNLSDCPKQEVTLTCTNTADATKDKIVWSHDPSLRSTTTTVKTKDTPATPNTPDTYTCTITKVNDKGETFIYTETFNVTTKDDCVGNNEEEEKITIGSTITIKSDYWDTPGADFNWYKIENGVKTPVSGDINSPGTITFTANESVTYECITTLPNGYTYTETRKVEVFNDTEEDVYICYGDDFNRTANTQNASEYKWYNTLNETEVLSPTKELEIKELKQNTSYICKIIGADGITKITETYHVKLNPLPAFNIEVKVADATINISAGTAPYNISLSDGTEATSNTSEYTFEELAENTYIVTITDKNKCVNSNEFTISIPKLTPDIFFSPNNDGVNDLWLVEGIETAPNAYIRIYDRYSKLLYQCKGADFKGWDGNYNGHGMVQDDYWYVISIPETEEQISGHFTLKR